MLRECWCNGRPCQSPSFSWDLRRMRHKSPFSSCHIASSANAVNLRLEYEFFWRRCRWRYCRNFHRCRSCRHSLISTWFQPRQNSTSSLELPLSSRWFSLRTDLLLSKPCVRWTMHLVPTTCVWEHRASPCLCPCIASTNPLL